MYVWHDQCVTTDFLNFLYPSKIMYDISTYSGVNCKIAHNKKNYKLYKKKQRQVFFWVDDGGK